MGLSRKRGKVARKTRVQNRRSSRRSRSRRTTQVNRNNNNNNSNRRRSKKGKRSRRRSKRVIGGSGHTGLAAAAEGETPSLCMLGSDCSQTKLAELEKADQKKKNYNKSVEQLDVIRTVLEEIYINCFNRFADDNFPRLTTNTECETRLSRFQERGDLKIDSEPIIILNKPAGDDIGTFELNPKCFRKDLVQSINEIGKNKFSLYLRLQILVKFLNGETKFTAKYYFVNNADGKETPQDSTTTSPKDNEYVKMYFYLTKPAVDSTTLPQGDAFYSINMPNVDNPYSERSGVTAPSAPASNNASGPRGRTWQPLDVLKYYFGHDLE